MVLPLRGPGPAGRGALCPARGGPRGFGSPWSWAVRGCGAREPPGCSDSAGEGGRWGAVLSRTSRVVPGGVPHGGAAHAGSSGSTWLRFGMPLAFVLHPPSIATFWGVLMPPAGFGCPESGLPWRLLSHTESQSRSAGCKAQTEVNTCLTFKG